ncbi:MAG: hypothetical protein COA96_16995 [SAR86 cluster bacterium]|uniref:Tail assembly chaperone n=1 Tax=SAR86 cluster bacterium TaxID=2030880 RepID=A0A2A5AHI1_9GAMM|nr:MAG: hypothetical protein COA96_16995 [SAR86 cluster bacterium]
MAKKPRTDNSGSAKSTKSTKAPDFTNPDEATADDAVKAPGSGDQGEGGNTPDDPSVTEATEGAAGESQPGAGDGDDSDAGTGDPAKDPDKDEVERPPFGDVVEISVPLCDPVSAGDAGILKRVKVEIRFTQWRDNTHARQQMALGHLYSGLMQTHARLANGKRVASTADVFKWMLERLADEIDPDGKVEGDGEEN